MMGWPCLMPFSLYQCSRLHGLSFQFSPVSSTLRNTGSAHPLLLLVQHPLSIQPTWVWFFFFCFSVLLFIVVWVIFLLFISSAFRNKVIVLWSCQVFDRLRSYMFAVGIFLLFLGMSLLAPQGSRGGYYNQSPSIP